MSPDQPQHPEFEEEEDLLPVAAILKVVVGVVVVAIALCLIAWAFLAIDESHLRPSHQFPEEHLGAPHRVAGLHQQPFEVIHPGIDLDARKRRELGEFGWVDRAHGVVRIPLDRALDWVASDPKRISGPTDRAALRKEAP